MHIVFADKNNDFPYALIIPDRVDESESDRLQRVIECLKHHASSISGTKFPAEIKDMRGCKWICYDYGDGHGDEVYKMLSCFPRLNFESSNQPDC